MNNKPRDPPLPSQSTHLLPGGGMARLDGGGELHYVFNTRGEIVDFWACKVQITLTPKRQMIFGALRMAA